MNSHIDQSLDYCSRLIDQLEDNSEILENEFVGKTASALKEAQEIQVKKLTEVRNLLRYL